MALTAQVSKSRRECDRILFGRGRGRALECGPGAPGPLWIAGAGGGSIQSGVVALRRKASQGSTPHSKSVVTLVARHSKKSGLPGAEARAD